MSRFDGLRGSLTYANVMATIAMFLALGGGAYAVSVPRNSVGSSQLKGKSVTGTKLARNAVTSTTVKDFSLLGRDFKSGQLPTLVGSRNNDADPSTATPRAVVAETTVTTGAGRTFVIATLRDSFLSCLASGPCSARWGIYVDGQAVPETGSLLEAEAGSSDGHSFDLLYGATVELTRGIHRVQLARVDAGAIESAGDLGHQVGAVAVN
jgi:hypothetical protein